MTTDHQQPQPAPEAPRLCAEREQEIRLTYEQTGVPESMIADLLAELDALRADVQDAHAEATNQYDVGYHRGRVEAEQERDEARAALAPFARAYWARHPGQDDRPIMTVWDAQQHEFRLTAGDFHRAADALASSPAAPKEPAPDGYVPTAEAVEFPDAASAIAWLQADEDEPAPDEGARGGESGSES